ILAVLENIKVTIQKAILVAGFSLPRGDFEEKLLQKKYNWKKIINNAKEFIFINSRNDPWGCNDKQGLYMWKKLGGTLILSEKEGHFGSKQFKQEYKEFRLLEKML
ncbi:MAG: alpha/beta hydrolase, partial [bacterium]|nr:alpha/beta hydrolase [bacterium]